MTTDELHKLFNEEFGLNSWPITYEVDHETYANVCQSIFIHNAKDAKLFWDNIENRKAKSDLKAISILIGEHNGIMFKNVELILCN
jgi:hypothetical protein